MPPRKMWRKPFLENSCNASSFNPSDLLCGGVGLWTTFAALTILAAIAGAADEVGLKDIREQITQLNDRLGADGARLTAAREQAFALQRRVAKIEANQDKVLQRIATKEARIAELRLRHEAAARTGREALENLLTHGSMHFFAANRSRLQLVLNQPDMRKLGRNLALLDYLAHNYTIEREALKRSTAATDELTNALQLEANSLRQLRQENNTQLQELNGLQQERKALIAAIELRMRDAGVRLEQLRLDEAKLSSLLQKLGQRVAPETDSGSGQTFRDLKGVLSWPVVGAVRKPRADGVQWSGVRISGGSGADVRSIAAGTVVFADWFRNLGMLVIVDHGDGYMSLYANNARVDVSTGAAVSAGDTIARLGVDGDKPGDLYFEIRAAGRPIDPRSWLAAPGAETSN